MLTLYSPGARRLAGHGEADPLVSLQMDSGLTSSVVVVDDNGVSGLMLRAVKISRR